MVSLDDLLANASSLTEDDFRKLPREELLRLANEVYQRKTQAQQENQLLFYKPVSQKAKDFHCSKAHIRGIFGGNGSSKSETQLVDIFIEMTGIIPYSLQDSYPKEKLRPPIDARLVVEDFTNTWEGAIKSKLIWNKWTGLGDGIHGHWGWIPRHLLKKGSFEESWSEKYRTLSLTNGSTLQIMAHSQETQSMSGASKHRIGVDEGCKHFEWRENLMRLREGGGISIAMTPPDDKGKSWNAAWIYDEVYVKGLPGPGKDPDIDSFVLRTLENPFIDREAIKRSFKGLNAAQLEVREGGAFMHLGGLVYTNYTDVPRYWCFKCNEKAFLVEGKCGKCNSDDTEQYCNFVEPDSRYFDYPVVFLVDPHPRKPVMCIWVAIDPNDDAAQIAELEVGGDVKIETVRDRILEVERKLHLDVKARIMDSKMKGQPGTHGQRGITVGDMWDQVGIRCKGADNNFEVGRNRLHSLFEPDPITRRPRYVIFNTCQRSNYMLKHFSWDDYQNPDNKDEKQTPRAYNDDFPALARYFANENYTYSRLLMGGKTIRGTRRERKRAYR